MKAKRRAKARSEIASPRSAPDQAERSPLIYTAQDVARFCEVDLKTIHHWADAGKIPHHRTLGRHLRFRRNDIVRFLRAHGYPLHSAITTARPTVFFAVQPTTRVEGGGPDILADVTRRLGARFFVRRFDCALTAIAHVVSDAPDALVFSLDDTSVAGPRTVAALKAHAVTAWSAVVAIGDAPAPDCAADLVLPEAELARLPGELANDLGVD